MSCLGCWGFLGPGLLPSRAKSIAKGLLETVKGGKMANGGPVWAGKVRVGKIPGPGLKLERDLGVLRRHETEEVEPNHCLVAFGGK